MSQDITLSPFYHSAVNEVTEPNSFAAHSHYLTRRWKRELGPTGYAILTSFRDRCFYNRKTGELRDRIQVVLQDIADECGISERTVRRELADNKALHKFIKAQREYAPDAKRGGYRFAASSYQVAMDDPVHPLDEERLLEIVRRKAQDAEKSPLTPLQRARLATSGQIDRTQTQPVNLSGSADNLSKIRDNLSGVSGQIDRTLIPDSSLPQMTLELTHKPTGIPPAASQRQSSRPSSEAVSELVSFGFSPVQAEEAVRQYGENACRRAAKHVPALRPAVRQTRWIAKALQEQWQIGEPPREWKIGADAGKDIDRLIAEHGRLPVVMELERRTKASEASGQAAQAARRRFIAAQVRSGMTGVEAVAAANSFQPATSLKPEEPPSNPSG